MRRALLIAAIVLGSVASVYQGWDMLFRTPSQLMLQGTDDSFYYFWVRSAIVEGDLDFRNDLMHAPTIDEPARQRALAEPLTPLGRVRNKYPIGWAVATLPLFLVAHALALAGGAAADGWQPVYFIVIWLGHTAYAVLGLFAARRVLARFMDGGAATIGVLAGWLASPLLYYQSARISLPHGLVFTLVALLYDRALAGQEDPAGRAPWVIGGFVAGLILITRPICAPYLLFPLFIFGRLLAAPATRAIAIRQVAWALLPALALVALQLFAQRQLHGAWRFDTYDSEPFHFARPELLATFFSPQHGWFYWHPLLLVGGLAFGLAVLRGRLPWEWLLSLALIAYINAAWWCWWWGSSFGNRSFEGATLFIMAGFGLLWAQTHQLRRWRTPLGVLLVLGITANTFLLALYMRGAISRVDAVTYPEMLAALWRQVVLFSAP
jgi:hypothetical protein